jgi:sugar/nucleoside kinase (ribokinase family)
VARRPGPDEKVTALRQDIAAGGPATNAAVTFAALGGHARLITALGSDRLAGVIRDELRTRGVEVIDVDQGATMPPALSAISVDDATGARSVTSVDATGRSVPAPPPSEWEGLLAGAAVVLLDGHHPLLAIAAARAAATAGLSVVLDAGRWKPVMSELIPLTGDVICSAEFRWPGSTDAVSSAAGILAAGPSSPGSAGRAVAVTHGADPVTWWRGSDSGQVPVPRVNAVDTLGAGDAFHGAYAFFRTNPLLSFTDRLAAAAQVASLRVATVGPRDWLDELRRPQS